MSRFLGVFAIAWALLWACPALAASTDSEGTHGSGSNDSLATAQVVGIAGTSEIEIQGWIDRDNQNDVDFFQFTLNSPTSLFFDIDLAEDINATSDDDNGLDTEIWVFDSAGTLIAVNDDSDFFATGTNNAGTDPGSDRFADHDSFVGPLPLAAGTYFVAVSYYSNDAAAKSQAGYSGSGLAISGLAVSGVSPDATFENNATCSDISDPNSQCVGPYRLQIRNNFASMVPRTAPALGSWSLLLLTFFLTMAAAVQLRRKPCPGEVGAR